MTRDPLDVVDPGPEANSAATDLLKYGVERYGGQEAVALRIQRAIVDAGTAGEFQALSECQCGCGQGPLEWQKCKRCLAIEKRGGVL